MAASRHDEDAQNGTTDVLDLAEKAEKEDLSLLTSPVPKQGSLKAPHSTASSLSAATRTPSSSSPAATATWAPVSVTASPSKTSANATAYDSKVTNTVSPNIPQKNETETETVLFKMVFSVGCIFFGTHLKGLASAYPM